ncbi:MAG: tryptophan 7-halogenase, partial [Verrucomicrobiales bacterium]|nr:tryptophan 7-halogenase [Verrucomicrobiales bacterium]
MNTPDPNSPTCDAVIVGGGPAGSTAAAFLAKAGHRVLVLERESFPRFHVGESLLPYNRRIFAEMGILEEVERRGFMVKQGAQFWLGNGRKNIQLLFREGTYNEEITSFQVERSEFDTLLLENAAKQGAEVRQLTKVVSYQVLADRVEVGVESEAAGRETVNGKFLIDATGQANFTGNSEKLREGCEGHRKIAIFGHFHGVAWPKEGERCGDVVVARLEDGWFWLIPLTLEKLSVGLVCDVERFKAGGLRPLEFFQKTVAEHAYV